MGVSVGYKEGGLKYSGSVEWRSDKGNISGARTTWLMRNTVGMQMEPAWRIFSKLNISRSSNNQGAFIDGNYREFVLGSAYRPIDNDRWHTLFKYTNFAGKKSGDGGRNTLFRHFPVAGFSSMMN